MKKRYANTAGGYVRVLKNGYRASGSDRASLAVVELIANPNDIVMHSAQLQVPVLKSQMNSINQSKYHRKAISLRNLATGVEQKLEKIVLSPNFSSQMKKVVDTKERAIHKKMIQLNKSVVHYSHARLSDSDSLKQFQDGTQTDIPEWIVPTMTKSPTNFIPERKILRGKFDVPSFDSSSKDITGDQQQVPVNELKQESDKKDSESPKIPQSFFQRFFRSSK